MNSPFSNRLNGFQCTYNCFTWTFQVVYGFSFHYCFWSCWYSSSCWEWLCERVSLVELCTPLFTHKLRFGPFLIQYSIRETKLPLYSFRDLIGSTTLSFYPKSNRICKIDHCFISCFETSSHLCSHYSSYRGKQGDWNGCMETLNDFEIGWTCMIAACFFAHACWLWLVSFYDLFLLAGLLAQASARFHRSGLLFLIP